MLLNLFDYLYSVVDFDFFGGLNLSEITVFFISLVFSCIVMFLPFAIIIKIVRRVG